MKRDLHNQSNPQISIAQIWSAPQRNLIDVRSQNEYEAGHIPGAINIPLLLNEEREAVGILYKNFGQAKAIEKGYEFLDEKLESFKQQFSALSADQTYTIYCARGGMRSQVTSSFLRYLGLKVFQLTGGYKEFRHWNLNQLEAFQLAKPIILHGKTGVGKTLVLNQLENALDLEGCAVHRGSLFGGVGKMPVSQKTFEANLLVSLEQLDNSKPIFIEGESRKIGDVSIPNNLFKQMRQSKIILLEASMEVRVARTIDEYITRQPQHKAAIREIIFFLRRDLGQNSIDKLISHFDAGNFSECFDYILSTYYDKKYAHSMKNLAFEAIVSTENIDRSCQEIMAVANNLYPL